MEEIYAILIQKGLKTLDEVPPKLKALVEQLLQNRPSEG